VKQIRKRLTYANVMSSLAIFLVIGGATAFAALGKNTVGSKQLKKNAVTTPKIKKNAVTAAKIRNGAVTGAKVNVSTLGKVPSAANADNAGNAGHANSADNANNANTVGGLRIVKFSFNGPSPLGKSQILDFHGLGQRDLRLGERRQRRLHRRPLRRRLRSRGHLHAADAVGI
jgi:hypothetical protein